MTRRRNMLSSLGNGSPLVLDGGLATDLERRGHRLDGELWSASLLLDDPDAIGETHERFMDAGASCITTATYQASFAALERRGLTPAEATEVFARGAVVAGDARARFLARRPDADRPVIAASLGSLGACRADGSEYRGGFGQTVDELVAFHRPRLAAVLAGADVIACETIPELREVRAFAALAGEVDVPLWISVTLRDGTTLRSGEPLAAAYEIVADSEAAAFSLNCSAPDHVTSALEALPSPGVLPVLAYANSGESFDGRVWCGRPATRPFVDHARDWLDRGAAAVGGCCRVTVEDVRAIADMCAGRRGDGGPRGA